MDEYFELSFGLRMCRADIEHNSATRNRLIQDTYITRVQDRIDLIVAGTPCFSLEGSTEAP